MDCKAPVQAFSCSYTCVCMFQAWEGGVASTSSNKDFLQYLEGSSFAEIFFGASMYLSQGKGGSEVLVLGSELNQAECISWPTWTWAWKLSFVEYTPVVIWLLETYANPVRGKADANLQDLLRYYSLPFSLWGINLIHYMLNLACIFVGSMDEYPTAVVHSSDHMLVLCS